MYYIVSSIKLVLGILTLILTYTNINVYEDPIFGIGLLFLGIFITSRGASFFLFIWIQKLYRNLDQETLSKESYKLSLLFGIYIIINFLLIIAGRRSKLLGLILLGGFIRLQISLFGNNKIKHGEEII